MRAAAGVLVSSLAEVREGAGVEIVGEPSPFSPPCVGFPGSRRDALLVWPLHAFCPLAPALVGVPPAVDTVGSVAWLVSRRTLCSRRPGLSGSGCGHLA